jgi:hypothetical protein
LYYTSTEDDAAAAQFSYKIYQGPSPALALQLVAYLDDGSTVLFDFSSSDAITGTFQDGTSFALNVNGDFRYVHSGCDFEIDGNVGGSTTKPGAKRTSNIVPRDTAGTAAVLVNVFNLCGQADPGQSITVQCSSDNLLSNYYQLTDAGNGAYRGSCAIELIDSSLCKVANQICSTAIGNQIQDSDHDATCNAIADLTSQAAAAGTEDAVHDSVLAACTSILTLAGTDLCGSYFGSVANQGENCQVPSVDLYMYAESIDGVPGHTVTNSRATVAPTGQPTLSATLTVGGACTVV